MEKRGSDRQEIAYNVDIIINGYVHANARTRDLGLGGTFLELGKSIPPPPGTEINLVFRHAKVENTALMASVARVTLDGIGCRFQNISSSELSGLKKLLVQS